MMFLNKYGFLILVVNFLSIQDAAGFFVKHVDTGMCINDTKIIQSENPSWGNVSFVALSNNCLHPAAQFRFRDNGAMLNLERKGCLFANTKYLEKIISGNDHLDMWFIYVDAVSLDRSACAQRPDKEIYRAITQTPGGALSVNFSRYDDPTEKHEPFDIWCAVPKKDKTFTKYYGIDRFLGLTKTCDDSPDQRFNFGSITCYGNMVKNVNCPKDQYIVVKNASYRGLSDTKSCGQSDEYSCEVNVTCLLKKQCDGQLECNVTVDEKLFPGDQCSGFTTYLYFEYQCSNLSQSYHDFCGGSPRNIKTTSRSTTSLSLTWDAPENVGNDYIISYTVCVSYSLDGQCFKKYVTSDQAIIIRNLRQLTKYYVRVFASSATESSSYSESKVFFTNARAARKAISRTASTMTFSLKIPLQTFKYFYIVVLRTADGKEPVISVSYENNELVTYAEAENSNNPQAYIAAVVPFSGLMENIFVVGDGSNTTEPASETRQSTSRDYYNGPLKPGTSYRVFQRVFINDQGDYYSTDWSPVSETNDYTGSPRVLTNISSGNIKSKVGDLVNILCSAQGEPPISFTWEKSQKILNSFAEIQKPQRSSFLVLRVKDIDDFGKYTCHIRDRFERTAHTVWIMNDTCTGTNEAKNDCKTGYLVGIVILAMLLVIFVFIFTYCFWCNHRKLPNTKQEKKVKETNDSREIYENPDKDDANNYEDVSNQPSTYTNLNLPAVNTKHVYCHLNEVQKANLDENAM